MSITIGSYTLRDPSEESIEYEVIGASYILASGNVQHDNINGTSTRVITLSWKAVTSTILADLISAYESLFTADRSYTDIRLDTFNITINPGRDKLTSNTVARGVPVYDVTMKFREVL